MIVLCFLIGLNANATNLNIEIEAQTDTEYVSFDLRNKTEKSIPLVIPGVMSPNLSPDSRSGVTLKVGQEILFKYNGKKQVLLTVTKDLEGSTIYVNDILEKRKSEIDAE